MSPDTWREVINFFVKSIRSESVTRSNAPHPMTSMFKHSTEVACGMQVPLNLLDSWEGNKKDHFLMGKASQSQFCTDPQHQL